MKVDGRRTSGNVEDRRGMSPGLVAVGGGIGTIVIVLVVLLLGGGILHSFSTIWMKAVLEQNK